MDWIETALFVLAAFVSGWLMCKDWYGIGGEDD